jgi:hypothetical protein
LTFAGTGRQTSPSAALLAIQHGVEQLVRESSESGPVVRVQRRVGAGFGHRVSPDEGLRHTSKLTY